MWSCVTKWWLLGRWRFFVCSSKRDNPYGNIINSTTVTSDRAGLTVRVSWYGLWAAVARCLLNRKKQTKARKPTKQSAPQTNKHWRIAHHNAMRGSQLVLNNSLLRRWFFSLPLPNSNLLPALLPRPPARPPERMRAGPPTVTSGWSGR